MATEGWRAEALFNNLERARKVCSAFSNWNIAINFNGMNGGADVKVFHDNYVVLGFFDPEDDLCEMLEQAVTHVEEHSNERKP